ncbi:OmpA family protein [Vibrio splendidus]|nr:OmpA family protein [Vibrio splendidus]
MLIKKCSVFMLALGWFSPTVLATSPPSDLARPFIGVKGGVASGWDYAYSDRAPYSGVLGGYGGLQFSPAWSADIGYQYHKNLEAKTTSIDVKTWLVDSALRYDWYLKDNLSLYGRVGAAYWEMEKSEVFSDKTDATGFSPLGEVGVNYRFTPNLRLSAGYQYIDSIGRSHTGKYDSHALMIGLTYTFDRAAQRAFVETASTSTAEERPAAVKETVTVKSLPQTQTFSSKTMDGVFGFGSIELGQDYIERLTDITSVLKAYPQAQAVVVGHADSTGTASYNQSLSERRAQAVVNKLIELEVAPTQLEWRGEGEARPIADNKTAQGRAENRRVEVTIPRFQFQE